MKRMSILLCSLVILAIGASEVRSQDAMESQLSARLSKAASLSMSEVKPNEIVKGDVTYSGIFVDVWKTDSLPELLNPFAPEKYGSAEDNTLRDSITQKASGWKFFSIRF
jgi:hypothetical protein